jgi:sugar phosphate isomerase/epimerase
MQLCLKAKYVSEDPAVRLAYCRELGFGATQESCKSMPAAVERGWPTAEELRVYRRPFDDAGISIAALEPVREPLVSWAEDTPAGRESVEVFARHLDAAGAAGIPCVTLHPPLDNPRSPAEAEAQFERNCAFYARVARRARDAGTTLATHSPYGSSRLPNGICRLTKPLWGKHAFEALFERVPDPANGMIYCFGCMYMDADDAAGRGAVFADMARFIDRIRFVHVRDVEMLPDRRFDEVLPGRGNVPAEEAIRRLWDLGYRGPITPEHTPIVHGEAYAGPVATAYAAGWCNAILGDLVARDATGERP